MCRERFAVEPDGIDTHMDQQLNPAVTQQPYGVSGLKQGGHLTRKRRNDFIIRRDDGHTLSQQATGEGWIGNLIERQYGARHR